MWNLDDFLTNSRSNISKLQIFLKNSFQSNWRSYLVLTSGQKLKNIKVSDFGLTWRLFHEYLQIKNFFSKMRLCHFSTFIVPQLHAKNQNNSWSQCNNMFNIIIPGNTYVFWCFQSVQHRTVAWNGLRIFKIDFPMTCSHWN